MKILLVLIFGLTMTSLSNAKQQNKADIIFINGDVYTGNKFVFPGSSQGTEAHMSRAHALAVAGGKILAIGTDAEIQKLKGAKTQVIDLGGHFVLPGLNDAHVHLASGGFEKLNVNLVGSKSLEEMKQRIAARVKTA